MVEKKGEAEPGLENESQAEQREGKVLVLGARREGGTLGVVMFAESQTTADTAARALAATGWATVEVYTRVSSHKRAN